MTRSTNGNQNSQLPDAHADDLLTVPTREQIRGQSVRQTYTNSTGQTVISPHVRPTRSTVRKTQPPVNDFDNVDVLGKDLPHESAYTSRGGAFSGRAYRKSRAKMPKLQRNLKYGQYLEIPKGQKSIFQSPEIRRRNRFIRLTALVITLLVIALVIWIALH